MAIWRKSNNGLTSSDLPPHHVGNAITKKFDGQTVSSFNWQARVSVVVRKCKAIISEGQWFWYKGLMVAIVSCMLRTNNHFSSVERNA